MRIYLCYALFVLCAYSLPFVSAGEAKVKSTKGIRMDYGPFLSYSVKVPLKNSKFEITAKAISVKLAPDAAICFDCDTLRYSAGWTGGFLDIAKTNIGDLKGSEPASNVGTVLFSTKNSPGWARGGDFADPRPDARGPLPADWAHYKGLYLNGSNVIFSYTVGDCDVLDMPGLVGVGDKRVFTRTIHLGKSSKPLEILVMVESKDLTIVCESGKKATPAIENGNTILKIPALAEPLTIKIGVDSTPSAAIEAWSESMKERADLPALCKGGALRWGEPIVTKGTLGKEDGAYALDTLTLPEENPFSAWMRASGLDFFSDGRAAVSTLNGDVWIVSGIDEKLEKLTWRRFATGLYEPLGLKIVKDEVYVLGRDQITRLRDLNGDGEADFYENFNNDTVVHPIYHAFAFDLQTDKAGNFYFVKGGNHIDAGWPNHNCMLKIAPDGSKTEVFATGFRAPNGMGIGPNDEISCSDNQGNWMPSSKISMIKKGGNYGFPGDPRKFDFKDKHKDLIPKEWDAPMCWIPYAWDKSSGGQVWVTSDKWGPLKNHMLHMSYANCTLFLVLMEEVNGRNQGGLVKFPFTFASGVMRARFNPKDGQLYCCGLKGWQTNGNKDGNLQRVRYTGKPVHMPEQLHVKHDGIELVYASPLDAASANDEQNYSIEQWNYKWSETYGSKEFSVANPGTEGHDSVAIKSVKLAADGKTVYLEIPNLKPVMQMEIKARIKAADGAPVAGDIAITINAVP